MKANSKQIILKDLGIMLGLMGDNMKAPGKIIKCMEEEFSPGLMEEDMKGNMYMIKNKVLDSLLGLMADHIKATGKMVSKTEKGLIEIKKDLKKMVLG